MKIEYVMLAGNSISPPEHVVDTITWDELDTPTYETGRARQLVERFAEIYGAEHARALLAAGWSNGYTSTRSV